MSDEPALPETTSIRPSHWPDSPITPWSFALGVVLVGALAAGFAIAFRSALTAALIGYSGAADVVSAMRNMPVAVRLLAPAFGGLCAGFLGVGAQRFGQSHGVGDVMEAVALGKVRLSMRVTVLKSLASFCAIGSPGGYALVGMAAATAACTHAPLMAAVLAFELSGDYAIVLPLVLSTALATTVSRRLHRLSIYSAELKRRGVSWELTFEGRRVVR